MDAITNLPGYQITELLYAGDRTLVYRGVRESDGTPVVIKLLRNEYPNFSELVHFRNQYTIAKNLNLPSIVKPLDLAPYKNAYALIMEDFGGVSLSTYLKTATDEHQPSKSLSIENFLNLALQLADILHYLYQNRVIHKDIKPANILIEPDSKQIKLIDFSISSLLPRETQEIQNPNILEGTLAYLSPEQTGRMNRGIDYRSDFYSLGVTCYELLTRQLPFVSDDPMELVHCHLAKQPMPIHQIKPQVPLILSQIVSKLMAKNAENRYQSALGLKHDLEICLTQLQKTGNIETFALGRRDITDRFLIPEKLYGRAIEVDNLLAAFERVSQGSTEMMLVAGFSGIGKTAAVNEVHKPIVRQRGYFIKGKYDQFQRNIPFSAFVQAFRNLMGQLLSESDAQLQRWKTRILSIVGDNGQVLIEVIPELERIIGTQPPVPELSGSAAQNRFNLLMQKFVQVFTTKEHPLVMFLDDLQWADSASLKLVQLLMQDTGHLLVLGAYRDNEVSPVHPFILTVNEIIKSGATVNTITLQPLSLADMNQLVADTLICDFSLAQPLTELLYQKTKGNPFFATQFLKALHNDKLITFNWDIRHWQCDIAKVKALAITDDVVEFMALQLQKLPRETQDVLKLAACIGSQFDLNTLAIVSEKSLEVTAGDLWKALQEGFILPISDVYKFFTQTDIISTNQTAINATYNFLHDRLQQAAYCLIPEDQKPAVHLNIGQLLLAQTSPEQLDERIFALVSQFNLGIARILLQEQRDYVANLNLMAGRKARLSAAYPASAQYCDIGLQLLATDNSGEWIRQPILTLELHIEAANSACLIGAFEQVDACVEAVIQHTSGPLEQVKALEIKIQSLIARNQLSEAIHVARAILQQLDVELPEHPTQDMVAPALDAIRDRLMSVDVMNSPRMSDPQKLAAMNILSTQASAAYIGSPALYPLIVLKQIELSLQFGNAIQTPYAYSTYGLILCAFGGEIVVGNLAADIAIALMEAFKASSFKAKITNLVYPFVRIWQNPIHTVLMPLLEGYQAGLETGDLEFAAYCAYNRCKLAYAAGNELLQLRQEMQIYAEAIAQLKQTTALNFHQIGQQAVLNWLGETEHPQDLIGAAYDETIRLSQHQAAGDVYSIGTFYAHKLILTYHFGQSQDALAIAHEAESAIGGIIGTVFYAIFYFYHALTLLANSDEIEHGIDGILEAVTTDLDRLTNWATHAPMNFTHLCDLIRAEQQRVLGHKADAIDLYDRAIALAKENGYIQEEALSNELTAKFYLKWGKEKVAAGYMQEAYYCYARWGAKAKVEDLEKRYAQLLAPILQQPHSSTSFQRTITQGTITSAHSSTSISQSLDLATLLKASQILSGEIELDKLLTTLLKIAVVNAGASKCVLVLKQDIELQVTALVEEGEEPQLLPSMPLESSQDVPISLVNTVKRSLKPLVVVDARVNPQFAGDRYIEQHQPKSVLCSPILNQGKLIGILYLENNLTVGAFTSDRVEVLNLISVQAAISLANARLYQESQQAFTDLKQAQLKIVQSEKMSALGNLVAGVAHEINNPVSFLAGNITPALDYINDLFGLLDLYQQEYPNCSAAIKQEIETIELDYIRADLLKLVGSMSEGVKRIKGISTSLRIFSRADSDRPVACNIHDGIDSTLMILKHRLKANDTRPEIRVIKEYGDLPEVKCYAGQINQVFMNLLANAIDALDESNQGCIYAEIANQITIETELSPDQKQVIIHFKDNGMGMSEAVREKIFDDLFTTKGVGKGTGLGLAIARQIVVEKHSGTIEVNSVLGEGTEFTIFLPVKG